MCFLCRSIYLPLPSTKNPANCRNQSGRSLKSLLCPTSAFWILSYPLRITISFGPTQMLTMPPYCFPTSVKTSCGLPRMNLTSTPMLPMSGYDFGPGGKRFLGLIIQQAVTKTRMMNNKVIQLNSVKLAIVCSKKRRFCRVCDKLLSCAKLKT